MMIFNVAGDEIRLLDCGANVIQSICHLGAPA